MPDYTIETTYRLPVFRHRTYSAKTPDAACRLAVEDADWSNQKEDQESSGVTYVTGIWGGADTAYSGTAVPVPPHFGEAVQRQAGHFEILLGLLKIMVADAEAGRATSPQWIGKATWAIEMAEAILAGGRGPDDPEDAAAEARGRDRPG